MRTSFFYLQFVVQYRLSVNGMIWILGHMTQGATIFVISIRLYFSYAFWPLVTCFVSTYI